MKTIVAYLETLIVKIFCVCILENTMYLDTFKEHRYYSQIRYKKAEEKRCTHTCGIFVPFPFHHDIFTLFFVNCIICPSYYPSHH